MTVFLLTRLEYTVIMTVSPDDTRIHCNYLTDETRIHCNYLIDETRIHCNYLTDKTRIHCNYLTVFLLRRL